MEWEIWENISKQLKYLQLAETKWTCHGGRQTADKHSEAVAVNSKVILCAVSCRCDHTPVQKTMCRVYRVPKPQTVQSNPKNVLLTDKSSLSHCFSVLVLRSSIKRRSSWSHVAIHSTLGFSVQCKHNDVICSRNPQSRTWRSAHDDDATNELRKAILLVEMRTTFCTTNNFNGYYTSMLLKCHIKHVYIHVKRAVWYKHFDTKLSNLRVDLTRRSKGRSFEVYHFWIRSPKFESVKILHSSWWNIKDLY